MKSINVLAFPGTNCQQETARAIRQAGFSSRIFRWNCDPKEIAESDGLIIAGGFSFEDRGRSGVIAAKYPVTNVIALMADAGKPILGICNGAQILVETGLVPGFYKEGVEMSLARNRRQNETGILGSGFYHDFVHLRAGGKKCAWTNFAGTLRLPIAHGEGRFLAGESVISAIKKNGQDSLLYCDKNGEINPHFPINPNGSLLNLAAVCNSRGNVMVMMPHPERAEDGQKIFASLHQFFKNGLEKKSPVFEKQKPLSSLHQKKKYPIEIYVSLKITDNTEKTIEAAAQKIYSKPKLSLIRQVFWGIEGKGNLLTLAKNMVSSDEFFNEKKELALFKIESKWFSAEGGKLKEYHFLHSNVLSFLAREKDDILGQEKEESLRKHANISVSVSSGILWSFSEFIPEDVVVASALLSNPVSWELERAGDTQEISVVPLGAS